MVDEGAGMVSGVGTITVDFGEPLPVLELAEEADVGAVLVTGSAANKSRGSFIHRINRKAQRNIPMGLV